MDEIREPEVVIAHNDHEALSEHYADQVLKWYSILAITFPEGIPESVHRFEYMVTERDEALPAPRVSLFEFSRLTFLMTHPTFDCLDLALNLVMLNRTTPNPATGCWERHPSSPGRYGLVNNAQKGIKNLVAHRIFWQDMIGNINGVQLGPLDVLDHRCLNKTCCYPRHLRLTTVASNNEAARLDTRHNSQRRLFVSRLFRNGILD